MTSRLIPYLLLVGVLGGCAALGRLPPAQQLILACDGYARTLTTLTAFNNQGRLTDQQVTVVNNLRPFLNEICEDTANVPSFQAALDRVELLMVDLYVMQSRVAANGA